MTGAILESLEYIKLLLDTSKIQAECLLDTATPSQIGTISQISRNLKTLHLDQSVVDAIRRKKSLFKVLSQKKVAVRVKGKLISKHRKFLLSIFMAIKPVLIGLINHISLLHFEKLTGEETNILKDENKEHL